MMKRFAIRRLFYLMCTTGILGLSSNAGASAFQLFEQDGASVGDYHAGRVAEANDASIAYYNPAGITRIKNQEFVISDVGILTNVKFQGTVQPSLIIFGRQAPVGGGPQTVTAQGGSFSQVPDFHYVAPLTDWLGLGLSLAVPFGLKTDYGTTTALRYAATLSQLQVVDLSPSFGVNITKKISAGAGLDVERMSAEFDQDATTGLAASDTQSINKGWDTAYGFHVGGLYQFMPSTRVGIVYNSQVVHHVRGNSKFVGPIANLATGIATGVPSAIVSEETNAHITLPAFTTISLFHEFNDKWTVMGTAIYTQWSVFKSLNLYDVAATNIVGITPVPTTSTTVSIPTNYRNTWDFSVGDEYSPNEKVKLRWGVGYDQSPVKNSLRDVRIPDNDRFAIALGSHFQATKTLGFDIGWTHLFVLNTSNVNPPPVTTASQVVTTVGQVKASADIFGAQLTWDIV